MRSRSSGGKAVRAFGLAFAVAGSVAAALLQASVPVGATGCGSTATGGGKGTMNPAGPPIVIGASMGLTGTLSGNATAMQGGLLAAVQQINGLGGILGREVTVTTDDDQSDPNQALVVAKMLQSSGVSTLIGPVGSQQVLSVEPFSAMQKLLEVSATATSATLTQEIGNKKISPKTGYFFRTVPSDAYQAIAVALFALQGPGGDTGHGGSSSSSAKSSGSSSAASSSSMLSSSAPSSSSSTMSATSSSATSSASVDSGADASKPDADPPDATSDALEAGASAISDAMRKMDAMTLDATKTVDAGEGDAETKEDGKAKPDSGKPDSGKPDTGAVANTSTGGCLRMDVVHNNDTYGNPLAAAIETYFKAHGGKVASDIPVPENPLGSYTSQVQQVVNDAPGCLVLAVYPQTAANFMHGLSGMQLPSSFFVIGTDGVYDPSLLTDGLDDPANPDAGSFVQGIYGTVALTNDSTRQQYGELQAIYGAEVGLGPGKTDLDPYTSNQYDAIVLTLLAMQAAGTTTSGEAIQQAMFNVSRGKKCGAASYGPADLADAIHALQTGSDINYQGASGDVDFDDYGDVIANFLVWEVKGQSFVNHSVITSTQLAAAQSTVDAGGCSQ